MRVLIIYYSRGGTTKGMAQEIHNHIESLGVEVVMKFCPDVITNELLDYDGIIIGSPTYYGTMASEIKKLLDDTVSFHGSLDGKAGAAFSSSVNLAGGNESTIIAILEAMLIHGMIIQGDPKGDHYGPVALDHSIDARCSDNLKRFSKRFINLLKQLKK